MESRVIPNPILPVAGVHRNIAADSGAGPPSGGHHDDRTSNARTVTGRVLSDHSTPSNALMRCRRPFVMGTINKSTAREEARLIELAHCAEAQGVEILEMQEHRRVQTDDPIVYSRVERCTFISASAWRNEAQAATGGVGLMLGSRARKALRRVYHHTDRILSAEFSGNPVTTIIVVYSPTNVAPSDVEEKFFEDLVTAVRNVPAHNFLAILGDQTKSQDPYTEEVRKRFLQLDREVDPSGEYRRFVSANEEASRLCVPMMERVLTSMRSKHPEVVAARGKVEEARLNFEREPTAESRGELNEAVWGGLEGHQ
ncbi:uncharacterized protein LOC142391235 [Odontesthes bonariensis]|uniref:uncharacterized protein LOC142391235 n=1 Tax=Odontesthes bonariensis TaxID=219752 RepID=UPI003F58C262